MNRLRPFLAIFFALVLTLTGHSMAVARGANDATGQMVLCIGATTVKVYTDATGTPTSAPHICPDCLASHLAAVLPGSTDLPDFVSWSVECRDADASAASAPARLAYLSRAPPRLV